jgi:hypothetical protein
MHRATIPPLRDPARQKAARKRKPGRSGRDDSGRPESLGMTDALVRAVKAGAPRQAPLEGRGSQDKQDKQGFPSAGLGRAVRGSG